MFFIHDFTGLSPAASYFLSLLYEKQLIYIMLDVIHI